LGNIEIIDVEFFEVAVHDEALAVGHEPRPAIESLPVMFLEILAALFHFDEHDGFRDVIGESRAAALLVRFADAKNSVWPPTARQPGWPNA
jgi:hypothetical protein